MISLDYTIIYQAILTVVLWLVISKLLFQPYLKLFEERERSTLGARHEAAELEHEGERLKAQYEQKIAEAQTAGYAAKEAILREARQQREQLLARTREEASRVLERVREEVRSEMERERQLAEAEAATVAREMVSKILGRHVA
jgi:F-type H+-transporting ATPase subunit b